MLVAAMRACRAFASGGPFDGEHHARKVRKTSAQPRRSERRRTAHADCELEAAVHLVGEPLEEACHVPVPVGRNLLRRSGVESILQP